MSGSSTSSARALVVIGLVVVAVTVFRGCLASGDGTAPSAAGGGGAVLDKGPGPFRVVDGIPVGFARSEAGAIAAGASYVTTGQVLLDAAPTELPELVSHFAAAATAEEQVSELTAQLDSLRTVLADGQGPVRYVQAVLATRLETYSPERARVAVWSVGVLWRHGAAEPQAGWTTTTFDLAWEDEAWKVWRESAVSGPSPAPNADIPPIDAAELDRRLSGFEPVALVR